MTIDEFIKTTHEEVEKFKLYYLGNRKQSLKMKTSEEWPLEQDEGEWYEQFIAWQGMDKE
jgi:hypothetical protein